MKIDYNDIIRLLKSESESVVEQLRADRTERLLSRKKNIDNAIKWLEKGMKNQISPDAIVLLIPERITQTPSSEFRIIEDHESDAKEFWTEVRLNDKELRPSPGDFLIVN